MRKCFTKNKEMRQGGFALLYAVLVTGALMSLVFATLNIVYKQAALSNLTKNSAVAFYAADSGMECSRYWGAYGAFNTANPAIAQSNFSTLDCVGNSNISVSNSASTLLANPISTVNIDPGFTQYSPSSFVYSLGNAYPGLSSAPQVEVDIWQNQQFAPDPTQTPPYYTTALLSNGFNNNNPNDPLRVQRGVGNEAPVTQCLAPAFTFGFNGVYGGHGWTGYSAFTQLVSPFFPGESLNKLGGTDFSPAIASHKTNPFSGPFFYLSYLPPDDWNFTPQNVTNAPTALSVTGSFLQIPTSPHYQFGYYVGDGLGLAGAVSAFVPIVDNEEGPVSIAIPENQNVHFAVCIFTDSTNVTSCEEGYSSGSDSSFAFWSTDAGDDVDNQDIPHDIVLSLPMPNSSSGISKNPNDSTHSLLAGKYVFGFDTGSSIDPASTYSGIVTLLQLVGCP